MAQDGSSMQAEQNTTIEVVLASSSVSATTTPLDDLDLLRRIVSFVGPNQYRFVTSINLNFKATYSALFPNNKSTCINSRACKHMSGMSKFEVFGQKEAMHFRRSTWKYTSIALLTTNECSME
jgi:hypothetical protein